MTCKDSAKETRSTLAKMARCLPSVPSLYMCAGVNAVTDGTHGRALLWVGSHAPASTQGVGIARCSERLIVVDALQLCLDDQGVASRGKRVVDEAAAALELASGSRPSAPVTLIVSSLSMLAILLQDDAAAVLAMIQRLLHLVRAAAAALALKPTKEARQTSEARSRFMLVALEGHRARFV